ncbi:MAG: lipopolysaccharide heptosyltransferase II [Acidobacteria bacterium]|nr:lipopolysaccharide heptosyltransferase II [Acidobacteriota bacterium]
MFEYLQVYDPRERRLVALADGFLGAAMLPSRLVRRAPPGPPTRILLLRFERIGDLLMTLPAISAVRSAAPNATIDLVVGSWNEPIARLIRDVNRIETLDLPWLSRPAGSASALTLARRALSWRKRHYDLAINLEGDLRSHLLMWLSGARRRVSFDMAGGAPLLTDRVAFDSRAHTSENALQLVRAAFKSTAIESRNRPQPLELPANERRRAADLLKEAGRRVIAVHVSGGRAIKQWPAERFADVAARLARNEDATIVLTGTEDDRPLVSALQAALPASVRIIDLAGRADLLLLAAVLEQCHALVTGDTGPMHVAAAVGTPVVAVFGLSDPARYGPLTPHCRIARIDLPCSPCNRVRRPPDRCRTGTPDCLAGIGADVVYRAAVELLARPVARLSSPPASRRA